MLATYLQVTNNDYGVTSSRPDNGVLSTQRVYLMTSGRKIPDPAATGSCRAKKGALGLRFCQRKKGAFASCNQIFVQ